MRKIFAFVLVIYLSACASVNSEFFNINNGDTKASVIARMGIPDDRQFQDKNEAFQYCTTGTSFGKSTFNVIWFYDGLVTGASSYTVAHAASCMGHFKQINWDEAPDLIMEIRNK